MRRALAYIVVAAALAGLSAAEPKSWNKLRYAGGTLPIKSSSYDWDTTVTISSSPDRVKVVVAASSPFGRQETLTLQPSQISSVIHGPGARQHVADVSGAVLPPKPHGLFGLLNRRPLLIGDADTFLAILFQSEDGKAAAMLLECDGGTHTGTSLGQALAKLAGKPLVYAK